MSNHMTCDKPKNTHLLCFVPRGYHSSVTSLTSLWSMASHIIAKDEDLGDATNEAMTEILIKILHHDICAKAMYVDGFTEGKPYCYRTHSVEM